ncbi:MAG: peptide chain release factor N(5)-glutamine methyltransferase [Lachnospiraceae bacterium]|nr:peptide chain release factor N(5)-glutamine methyltransferase [Lachnospiraceae bacterium]
MNYREAYEYGAAALKEKGLEEAELDARLLLEFVCKTTRSDLYAHGDREISHEEFETYLFYLMQRGKHIPLQHLTREQEFMGLTFQVNEHVLIPRQDTETLVEEVLMQLHDGMRILDLCTGSGCILLSLLHYSNSCEGIGADVSEEALAVARDNAHRLGLEAVFLKSDLFENVTGSFDIIVSNPPYIETKVIDTLMEEVREHEPRLALDGGEDGLLFYRRIAEDAKRYLCRGGMLFLEIGYRQAEDVGRLLERAGYVDIEVKKDLAGLDRVVYAAFLEDKHV